MLLTDISLQESLGKKTHPYLCRFVLFDAGFRSRVRYTSVLDPTNMCYYISEILDPGRNGPLFMVMPNCSLVWNCLYGIMLFNFFIVGNYSPYLFSYLFLSFISLFFVLVNLNKTIKKCGKGFTA